MILPLLSCEIPPGGACRALGSSAQERHGPGRVDPPPNEGYENGERAGTPLLWRKTE